MIGHHLTVPQICAAIENINASEEKPNPDIAAGIDIILERYTQLRDQAEKLENEFDNIEAAYMMDMGQIESIMQALCSHINGSYSQIMRKIKEWEEIDNRIKWLSNNIKIEPNNEELKNRIHELEDQVNLLLKENKIKDEKIEELRQWEPEERF